MPSFNQAASPNRTSPNTFEWSATQSWFQGRGVYGGLTFAMIAQAVEAFAEFPLRRLSVELCAPVSELKCELQLEQLRRGSSTQFVRFVLLQENQVVIHGSATCGLPRSSALDCSTAKELPSYNVPPIPRTPLMPPFSQHFIYRLTTGELPMSGHKITPLITGGWITPRCQSPIDIAVILGAIDGWWPALYLATRNPVAMGTISFAADIVKQSNWAEGPMYIESTTTHCTEGYAIEENRLWDHTGALLAQAQQSVAVIR